MNTPPVISLTLIEGLKKIQQPILDGIVDGSTKDMPIGIIFLDSGRPGIAMSYSSPTMFQNLEELEKHLSNL